MSVSRHPLPGLQILFDQTCDQIAIFQSSHISLRSVTTAKMAYIGRTQRIESCGSSVPSRALTRRYAM